MGRAPRVQQDVWKSAPTTKTFLTVKWNKQWLLSEMWRAWQGFFLLLLLLLLCFSDVSKKTKSIFGSLAHICEEKHVRSGAICLLPSPYPHLDFFFPFTGKSNNPHCFLPHMSHDKLIKRKRKQVKGGTKNPIKSQIPHFFSLLRPTGKHPLQF